MDIYLDKLDIITQNKYQEFKEKVEELLAFYQKTNSEKYNLVKEKIEQTKGKWDTTIDLIIGSSRHSVNISQLLIYEYCLASERITDGKVSFEAMLDKLFKGVKKFRIGNSIPGIDDECLYGSSFDDTNAIPVTSKLYRLVMNAGAQKLDYFKDGNFTSAVFIYERKRVKDFAKDENGNLVDMITDGIEFSDLSKGQSLLTNLRQTAFHEWNHNAEEETIETIEDTIDYEYKSEDGKIYRNYEKVKNYVTSENIGIIQEPQYIISTQIDSEGNRKKFFQDKNGKLRPLSDMNFGLEKKQLEKEYCFSSGLTTREVLPNGKTKMHNIITEGFVEETARAMIRAIDPKVRDIDEEKYYEYVEIAKRVIESRDISLGDGSQGQTYADFLMHSSILKKDLESRTILLDNGNKVDGLHYISDYADRVQSKKTMKSQFYKNIPKIITKLELNLSKSQIDILRKCFLKKRELTEDDQKFLRNLLVGGNLNNQADVDKVISDYVNILEDEAKFFNGIAGKLGFTDKTIEERKSIQELVKESIEGVPNLTILDNIEQAQEKQRRTIFKQKKESLHDIDIGD